MREEEGTDRQTPLTKRRYMECQSLNRPPPFFPSPSLLYDYIQAASFPSFFPLSTPRLLKMVRERNFKSPNQLSFFSSPQLAHFSPWIGMVWRGRKGGERGEGLVGWAETCYALPFPLSPSVRLLPPKKGGKGKKTGEQKVVPCFECTHSVSWGWAGSVRGGVWWDGSPEENWGIQTRKESQFDRASDVTGLALLPTRWP